MKLQLLGVLFALSCIVSHSLARTTDTQQQYATEQLQLQASAENSCTRTKGNEKITLTPWQDGITGRANGQPAAVFTTTKCLKKHAYMGEMWGATGGGRFLKDKFVLEILQPKNEQENALVQREYTALSAIKASPAATQLHTFGPCTWAGEKGQQTGWCIVLKYTEGTALSQYGRDAFEKDREIPLTKVLRLIRGVAEALSDVHAKGHVHNYLSPDSVILSTTWEKKTPFASLTDFSFAAATGTPTDTRDGWVAGYRSGDEKLSGAGDVYALGMILWQLVDYPGLHLAIAQQCGLTTQGSKVSLADWKTHSCFHADKWLAGSNTDKFPADIKSLLEKMIAANPDERPTAKQLIAMIDVLKVTDKPASSMSRAEMELYLEGKTKLQKLVRDDTALLRVNVKTLEGDMQEFKKAMVEVKSADENIPKLEAEIAQLKTDNSADPKPEVEEKIQQKEQLVANLKANKEAVKNKYGNFDDWEREQTMHIDRHDSMLSLLQSDDAALSKHIATIQQQINFIPKEGSLLRSALIFLAAVLTFAFVVFLMFKLTPGKKKQPPPAPLRVRDDSNDDPINDKHYHQLPPGPAPPGAFIPPPPPNGLNVPAGMLPNFGAPRPSASKLQF